MTRTGGRDTPFEGISERGSARLSARAPWRPPLGTRTTSGRWARVTRPEKNVFGHLFSRGYSKLSQAADAFNFDFRGKTVLDIGSSTGGFTKYALDHGATKVIAVEKGTNQMMSPLRYDPRIELHEKTNIFGFKLGAGDGTGRGPAEHSKGGAAGEKVPAGPAPSVIVADVSFVSLTKILAHAKQHLADAHTEFLVMLKPQFEAKPYQLNKGIVKNETIRREVIKNFESWLKANGFLIVNKRDNNLKGRTGNREKFYYLTLAK